MKSVLKELWRNFWIPLILSVVWATFRAYDSETKSPVSSFVANFSASLFLISWAVGQYKRVQKQLDDKEQFNKITANLTSLVNKMEEYASQLAGFTLGDSKDLLLSMGTDSKATKTATFSLVNEGKYPVYDVRVHWVDMDDFRTGDDYNVWNWNARIVPTIKPGEMELDALKFDMSDLTYRRIFIYITWRNGSMTKEFEISRDTNSIMFQPVKRESKR